MRVSKGRLWFSLLLLVEQVSSVRDGFQPLPLRPQDQIKGGNFNLCDKSLVCRTDEHFSWFRGFSKILEGLWDPRFDKDRGRPLLFKSKEGLTR